MQNTYNNPGEPRITAHNVADLIERLAQALPQTLDAQDVDTYPELETLLKNASAESTDVQAVDAAQGAAAASGFALPNAVAKDGEAVEPSTQGAADSAALQSTTADEIDMAKTQALNTADEIEITKTQPLNTADAVSPTDADEVAGTANVAANTANETVGGYKKSTLPYYDAFANGAQRNQNSAATPNAMESANAPSLAGSPQELYTLAAAKVAARSPDEPAQSSTTAQNTAERGGQNTIEQTDTAPSAQAPALLGSQNAAAQSAPSLGMQNAAVLNTQTPAPLNTQTPAAPSAEAPITSSGPNPESAAQPQAPSNSGAKQGKPGYPAVDFAIRATAGARAFAYIADILLLRLASVSLYKLIDIFSLAKESLLFRYSAAEILLFLLGALYFTITTLAFGGSLGKKIFGLRVVGTGRNFEKKLKFFNIFYRETIGRFLNYVLLLGYILPAVDARKQTFADLICDTVVIYKN